MATATATATSDRTGIPAGEPDVLEVRRVRYDWEHLPRHWVPDDPATTHLINVLHVILPPGERWFVRVFKEALPHIDDPVLRRRVRAFMGQEGTHAVAHSGVLGYFEANDIDVSPMLRELEVLFDHILSPRAVPRPFRRTYLSVLLAGVAAVEHYTAVLGQWILDEGGALDEAGADGVMMDLIRWHGAEEVEHRSVAYDLFEHVSGSTLAKFVGAGVAFPGLFCVWGRTMSLLLEEDDQFDGPASHGMLRHYPTSQRRSRAPSRVRLFLEAPRYLAPWYHPSRTGNLASAIEYIASSPSHAAVRT